MHELFAQAWLIARREYLERVRSRVYRVTTVLTPVLLALLFGNIFSSAKAHLPDHIVIASSDLALAHAVKQELSGGDGFGQVDTTEDTLTPAQIASAITANRLDGYLQLTNPPTYTAPSELGPVTRSRLETAIAHARLRLRLSPAEAASLLAPVTIEAHALSTHHVESALAMVFLLYTVIIFYGMDVARSVIQEKTSRIFEVLLATARPESLMLGKLLGVGAAAFTQVGIWILLVLGLSGTALAAQIGLHGFASLGITPAQIVFFVLFFLLGYLFYSAMSAAIGAVVSAEQEIQQFSLVIVVPLMVGVVRMNQILNEPNSVSSTLLSLFPPCAPIVMYLRICATEVPGWQISLSLVLLIAAIAGMLWLGARLYRVGILMYGKRPTLPEMARWLRYS
jgi:ABC-2 type transport system permease protein